MSVPIQQVRKMRSWVLSFFAKPVFIGLVLGGPILAAQETNSAVPRASSGSTIPGKSDSLILGNGEKLKGTVLNEHFSFRTAYAHFELKKAWLASIDLARDSRNLSTAFTINSNRYTGFLEDDFLFFQPDHGNRMEIRRERISRVLIGDQNHQGRETLKGKWVRLKNGDLLSGQVSPSPLPLVITNVQVSVNPDDLTNLTLTSDRRTLSRAYPPQEAGLVAALATDYLVVELDAGPRIEIHRDAIESIGQSYAVSADPNPEPVDYGTAGVAEPPPATSFTNLEGLVWIPAGEFIMGSPYNEIGRDPDEGPQVKVRIAKGFWMGKCEVSQAEYEQMMGTNPSPSNEDTNLPVVKVNWFEAMDYCTKLTQMRESAGRLPSGYAFRLPTEAEWEYACRAGTTTRFSCGEDKTDSVIVDYAWYTRNSEFMTHPVGLKKPNPWGLHDMHGNVMEWCLDRYERITSSGKVTDSAASAVGNLRVARGGSWLYEAKACRSANRDDYGPSNRCSDIGFRVVLAPALP
jgi:formylglycine-generating enzyme required for sulfatase activity